MRVPRTEPVRGLRLILPVLGVMAAEVRWSKGKRFGCMFDVPIDRASYFELLAKVLEPLPPSDPQPDRSKPTAASRSNK